MTRFASLVNLVNLLRIFITGLILIAIFALARSSPSALRSYEGEAQQSAPALKAAPALIGVPTPAVAGLFLMSDARPVAGPTGNTPRWSGLLDNSGELTRQLAPMGRPAADATGPASRIEDSGPKTHGGSVE